MRAIIKSVFAITGRGTAITALITDGQLKSGDRVLCPLVAGGFQTVTINGVEDVRDVEAFVKGEYPVGLLLDSLRPDQIAIGKEIREVV